jgi:hypothetical protein
MAQHNVAHNLLNTRACSLPVPRPQPGPRPGKPALAWDGFGPCTCGAITAIDLDPTARRQNRKNKNPAVSLLTQTLIYFHSFLLTAIFSLALLMATDGGKKAAPPRAPRRRACSPMVEHAVVERPRSGAIGSRACATASHRRAVAPIAFPARHPKPPAVRAAGPK